MLFNITTNEHGIKNEHPRNITINEFGRLYDGSNFGTQYLDVMRMFMKVRYDIYQNMDAKHILQPTTGWSNLMRYLTILFYLIDSAKCFTLLN